jgi:hypothetical protein
MGVFTWHIFWYCKEYDVLELGLFLRFQTVGIYVYIIYILLGILKNPNFQRCL